MIQGKFRANKDLNVKYTFQLGGGIKGRTVKAGEIVTAIGITNDVNSQSVSCIELLNRIEKNAFEQCFTRLTSEECVRLELNELAQKKGLKNYMIDNGTDRRTQNDILVLLDIDHDGMIVAQKEY